MARKKFDAEMLSKVRALRILGVLDLLQSEHLVYYRRDETFFPVKNGGTLRLHVSIPSGESWEILLTDQKWFDVRAEVGGGGIVDLIMHLKQIKFLPAMNFLVPFLGQQ